MTPLTPEIPTAAPAPIPTITGCWEGALISQSGEIRRAFALRQPPRVPGAGGVGTAGPALAIDGGTLAPARVLEGAARSLVALVEGTREQLLLEARVADGHLVGRWLRRDRAGRIVSSGTLVGERAANLGG